MEKEKHWLLFQNKNKNKRMFRSGAARSWFLDSFFSRSEEISLKKPIVFVAAR